MTETLRASEVISEDMNRERLAEDGKACVEATRRSEKGILSELSSEDLNSLTREEVLATALRCVCGNREQDYGSPERNFEVIASFWNTYLAIDTIKPKDVAAMLGLLKIARIGSGHAKADNWIDLAGYAACGGELEATNATG